MKTHYIKSVYADNMKKVCEVSESKRPRLYFYTVYNIVGIIKDEKDASNDIINISPFYESKTQNKTLLSDNEIESLLMA